jgi:hypothetical protein
LHVAFLCFCFCLPLYAGDPLWSLKPVSATAVPENAGRTTIDRYLLKALAEKKLAYSPRADARTQVRRLYFYLVGLPPSVEVVEAFAKNPTDEAYTKIVDELLASPHYGERWARHWLDLVRYGESDGFERNAPRPTAWHYRDWVICALNDDLPYDRFAKLQIAGDMLAKDDPTQLKATGLLVAGIHNTVLGSNKVANDTARQDELEDIISVVGQSFLGLSVQCARCHDHKFDPITQKDYYRVAASLTGVLHGERTVVVQPSAAQLKREQEWKAAFADVAAKLQGMESTARMRLKIDKPVLAVQPVARWSFEDDGPDRDSGLTLKPNQQAKIERGRLILDGKAALATSDVLKKDITAKTLEAWVQLGSLDQRGGGVITLETTGGEVFDSIVFGEQIPKRWLAGSNNFQRTRDLQGIDETDSTKLIHVAMTYTTDGKITAYRNGVVYGRGYVVDKVPTYQAGKSRVLLGLRHTGAGNGALRGEIDEARLYDRALTAEELAESFRAGPNADRLPEEKVLSVLSEAERKDRERWLRQKAELQAQTPLPVQPEKVFAVTSGKPEVSHVLSRGDVTRKRAEVTAGGVECVPGQADFQLKADSSDGERRGQLAQWIAQAENPLFTRVIVNRLWQHHFGIGLVETPSDLGYNGAKPSHPELLDFLARELVQQKFHLKPLHKLMVCSDAYRQASTWNEPASKIDSDNRLLWRKTPTRIDAEILRDAMLEVSGVLNKKAGGPGFIDVRIYGDAGTTFYDPIDVSGPEFDRRTIYRFSPRGERSALLETFDCPDPSAQSPRRQITTTPLQALALWNNSLVLRLSRTIAERATKEQATPESRIERLYRLMLARSPSPDEVKDATALVAKHGLPALARVLFNCNEFVVIP